MNKRGFTLVEVIVVISLLGLVVIISSTGILSGSTKAKEKLLQTKIKNIEKAAVLYGQDNRDKFSKDTSLSGVSECLNTYCNGKSNCYCYHNGTDTKITVGFLANPDGNDNTTDDAYLEYDDKENKLINSPVDGTSMKDKEIQIYQKYGKIYADYLDD